MTFFRGIARKLARLLDPSPVSHTTEHPGGPFLADDLAPLIPPRDLWVWPPDPLSQYLFWAWGYPIYLNLLCDLRAHSSVLELGCNHGRTMLGLIRYLKPPGRYEGLDILRPQVEFAQRTIQRGYPHFTFTLGDIHHSYYNPQGSTPPETYRFPYADGSFDVIYAASLFTHLLPPATSNYFKESRRVLRKGGRCLFSFFVLDYYKGPGTTHWDGWSFEHTLPEYEGLAVRNPTIADDLDAYSTPLLEKMAADAGLCIERIVPGYWSKNPDACMSDQDLIILKAI